MTLKTETMAIVITDDESANFIKMKWVDEGVAEINLSDGFMVDKETIVQLTPVIMDAFKELMGYTRRLDEND